VSIEARQHPRARAKIRVEFHFGATTGVGTTNDVSEGGLFLETDTIAPEGSRIYLRLHVPGGSATEPLRMIGVVRRQRESLTGQEPHGMGIRFEVAYARARESLGGFIEEALVDPATVRDSTFDEPRPTDEGSGPLSLEPATATASIWLWGAVLAALVLAIARLLM